MCGCPGCKGFFGRLERVIGYGHVSGLSRAAVHVPRAGMAMRRSGPNQCREREALWEGLVSSTSILSISLSLLSVVLLTSPARRASRPRGRNREILLSRHHRPDCASGLVGERAGHQHARLSLEHAREPGPLRGAVLQGPPDAGHRADDEQAMPPTDPARRRNAARGSTSRRRSTTRDGRPNPRTLAGTPASRAPCRPRSWR